MKQVLQVSREQLTRYLTMLHFESVPQTGTDTDRVCAHVRARGAIQFDPIDIVGRNADLTLQSRVDGYRPEMLSRAIYEEHRLYDGYDKNLCIYPIEDYPCFARMRTSIAGWFRDNPDLKAALPKVLAEVENRGELCSDDLNMNEKIRWPWGSARISRAALESLWMAGILAISRREGVKKYYNLAQRCYDAGILNAPDPNPEDGDYFAWQTLRRVRSVGLLTGGASDAFLGIDHFKAAERNASFERLTNEGSLIPVEEGKFRGYIPCENEEILLHAENSGPEDRVRLIAPLDNLMWDRRLIEKLFGFEYRWEIYVPADRRKYGYYVLPVMCGNHFVARCEPERFDGKTLRIRNWWWEEGWSARRLPGNAVRDAMERFAHFLGAKDIECKC